MYRDQIKKKLGYSYEVEARKSKLFLEEILKSGKDNNQDIPISKAVRGRHI